MVLRHVSILRDHPQGVNSLPYCCHNAGVNRRDFKFSVLNFKNS